MARLLLQTHRRASWPPVLVAAEEVARNRERHGRSSTSQLWPSAWPRCARGGARSTPQRVHEKGKLTAWERIEALDRSGLPRCSRSAPS